MNTSNRNTSFWNMVQRGQETCRNMPHSYVQLTAGIPKDSWPITNNRLNRQSIPVPPTVRTKISLDRYKYTLKVISWTLPIRNGIIDYRLGCRKILCMPTSKVGQVIGRRGYMIRRMEKSTGAKFKIGRSNGQNTFVSIRGIPGAVVLAEGMLNEIVFAPQIYVIERNDVASHIVFMTTASGIDLHRLFHFFKVWGTSQQQTMSYEIFERNMVNVFVEGVARYYIQKFQRQQERLRANFEQLTI